MQFPEAGVFQERVIAVKPGEDEAGHAVAESLLNDVFPENARERRAHQIQRGGALAGVKFSPGHQRGVTVGFSGGHRQRGPGMLPDEIVEVSNRAGAIETFVDQVVAVAEFAPVKNLRLPVIGIHPAEADGFAQKCVPARDVIGVEFWLDEGFAHFGGKFRRGALVGVNAHDPIVREQVKRLVANPSEPGERHVDVAHAKFRADRRRAIRAERINVENFVRPFDRGQQLAEVGLLVETDDVE